MVQFLLLGVAELVSLLLLVPSINAKGHVDCCPVTTFLTWVFRRGTISALHASNAHTVPKVPILGKIYQ